MPEALSAAEVGKETSRHADETREHAAERRDRVLSIAEAALLSVVTLLAAWSGYSAAKWGSAGSIDLAEAAAARTNASRANLDAMETRNFDSSTFDAWFTAFTAGNTEAMAVAEQRFRPEFRVAFDAWRATNPDTNPDALPDPTFVSDYDQPDLDRAAAFDAEAESHFRDGVHADDTSDRYVRLTVFLASVLFLVGISTHLRVRGIGYGLVALGCLMLAISVVQLSQLPGPP
jgi:hypothetical protein